MKQFPMTDIQVAYMVGKSQLIELGGRQQYYIELDAAGFDPVRAEEALNLLIRRHEHLRTVMLDNGEQRVLDEDETPRARIHVHDLTSLNRADQEAAIAHTAERMCDEGLDPNGWPLFEVVVSQIRHHRSRVHLRVSLLLLDAPSIRQTIGEWRELYDDPAAKLPPVEQTFREWRLSLLEYEKTDAFRDQWLYWKKRLDSLPEAPQLPLSRQPKSIDSVSFTGRTTFLTKEEWQQFCANFRRHKVLPTTALIHVYAEVLGAWAATPHFCLNVVHLNMANRHKGPGNAVGQRTATLPLEVDLRGDAGFWERARRLQTQLWRDMANSDVTGVRISRELAALYGWTERAVFPYVFTSNQGPGWDSMTGTGRPAYRFLRRIQHTPQVLIDNQIRDAPDGGIGSNLDFVDAAFPPGLPEAMSDAYRRILHALARPDAANIEPDPVSPGHRALISAVNDTRGEMPAGRIESGFLRQAAAEPGAIAIVTSQRTLTYEDLEKESRAVARWLLERGIEQGEIVPVIMAKGWEQVVAVLGALRAGAAYCPIDSATPIQAMLGLLDECNARVALTQAGGPPMIDALREVPVLHVDQVKPSGSEPIPAIRGDASDLAYVIYTSGSTGRPKGVMIEHRGALNTVLDINQRVGLGPEDRVFGISSMSFDLSVWDVFGSLAAGSTLVIPDGAPWPDPIGWAAMASCHGVTVWNSVPALTEMLAEVAEQRSDLGLAPIRAFLLSGDWIPTSLPDRLRRVWHGARVVAMGGATEASIWSNIYEVGDVDPGWRSIPYGVPLANQTMWVLDERLDVRPPWAAGQIYIGGCGLARGYLRDEEGTSDRFIRHPRTGERLYRTGDLGRYWWDGTIEFLGREDRQVKILGFRVEPAAIEAAIRSHPDVHECAVCPEKAPGGQQRLVSLVVPRPGRRLDPQIITGHIRAHLPHYMIPGQIHIADRLPLTRNGKVDVAQEITAVRRAESRADDDGADSPLAKKLGTLWAELLELPSVDPDSNFVALGGNSLLALRMINRVRAELGVDLALGQIFETPTVRELATYIERGVPSTRYAIELAGGSGEDLFLFPVLGGSVTPYAALARAWDGPVVAFQGQAFTGGSGRTYSSSLPEIAAIYREELQRRKPDGPYVLGGWSLGGYLAYEVARQLTEQGQRSNVFMIDSDLQDIVLPSTGKERHLAFFITLALGPPPKTAVEAISNAPAGNLTEFARDVAVSHGLLPAEVDAAGYEHLLVAHEHELRAVAGYEPGRLDQPTLLILAADETGRPDPEGAWREVCPRIEVETAPGDHFSIGTSERLQEIARRVAAWVSRTRSTNEPVTTSQ
jgi:amino acid adenylation domain-containing protein